MLSVLSNIKWSKVRLAEIRVLPAEFTLLASKQDDYVCRKSRVGPKELQSLSRQGALALARLHPIIVWTNDHYCVSGIRTLLLITPNLPANEVIPVGILPSTVTGEVVKELIQADDLLTSLAFAKTKPASAITVLKSRLPKSLVARLSPALGDTLRNAAELLGVSVPTLYATLKKHESTSE